jgi:hypothetical protein
MIVLAFRMKDVFHFGMSTTIKAFLAHHVPEVDVDALHLV